MSWSDHGRRAATVLLVALALLAVPAVSDAQFAGRSTANLAVGTAQLAAPTSVSGTYQCARRPTRIDVTINGFTSDAPANASYKYTLLRGSVVADSQVTTAKAVSLRGSTGFDNVDTTWTVLIQSSVGSWTGTPFSKSILCTASTGESGNV